MCSCYRQQGDLSAFFSRWASTIECVILRETEAATVAATVMGLHESTPILSYIILITFISAKKLLIHGKVNINMIKTVVFEVNMLRSSKIITGGAS